jgi:hypothetical protein
MYTKVGIRTHDPQFQMWMTQTHMCHAATNTNLACAYIQSLDISPHILLIVE